MNQQFGMFRQNLRALLVLLSGIILIVSCDLDDTPHSIVIRDDLQYIELMVPHHQLAVDMAELANDRAAHGQLKGLARDIILSQQDEINRMLIWKGKISATTSPKGPKDHVEAHNLPGMNVDLDELAASPDFDRDFIQAMIPHHQSAIDMSRAALPNLKRRELRDLAQDIITVQQIEIERMQGWLKEWFAEP